MQSLSIFIPRQMPQTTWFRVLITLLLGFASGLPLGLSGNTLQAWYASSGVDITTIGMVALVGQPYAYKFIWSPLVDKWQLAILGRYKLWILGMQAILIVLLCQIANMSPLTHPHGLMLIALMLAFASATQDIAIDAYRTEFLPTKERGLGAAFFVTGYRLAMIVAGGVGLIMADKWGFRVTYFAMAGCLSLGVIAIMLAPTLQISPSEHRNWREVLVDPFKAFMNKESAVALLFLVVLYKLGDAFAGVLTTTFLIRGLELSLSDVGWMNKIVGLIATIAGAILGGLLLKRISLYRALMWFGIIQALSNALYSVLAYVGHYAPLTISAVALENLCGGMGTAAFLAFLMNLCDKKYTATQFALLSALSAVGRIYVGPSAGYMVEYSGWGSFFIFSVIVSLPGLFLLRWLKNPILKIESDNQAAQDE